MENEYLCIREGNSQKGKCNVLVIDWKSSPSFGILIGCSHISPCPSPASVLPRGHRGKRQCLVFSVFTADSGVSSAMQVDDVSNQQNGNYQSLPEPISAAQMISSPPALVEHYLHQPAAAASDESFIQAPSQVQEGVYQQATGQLHPGAYQQSTAQLHQGPYHSQTVSEPFSSQWQLLLNPLFFVLCIVF